MTFRRILLASVAVAAMSAPGLVSAQDAPPRGINVADRERPDYDPIGIRAGGFIIYPSVTGSVAYEDNLFRQPNNEQDDTIFAVTPEVVVESQWSRHELNAGASLTTNAHDENDSDNVTSYDVFGEGRLDVTRDTFLNALVSYAVAYEDRGSPDLPRAAAEPAEFATFLGQADLTHRFNRLSVRPGFTYTDIDYEDVGLVGGGALNNDDRDRNEIETRVRVGYDVSPALQTFVTGRYRETEYDNFDDNLGGGGVAKRDSDAFDVLAGAAFDLGALARGEVAVGYTEQDYDSALIPEVDGFIYEAGVEWFVTELTTVTLGGSRSVEETTINNAAGYLATSVAAGIDHELMRNVLVGADAYWSNSEYEGINRDDDVIGVGVDGTYLINRNFRATLGYDYEQRDSNALNADYDANVVLLSLRAAL